MKHIMLKTADGKALFHVDHIVRVSRASSHSHVDRAVLYLSDGKVVTVHHTVRDVELALRDGAAVR